jgi:O-antigen/teichoic acid export membrane protein
MKLTFVKKIVKVASGSALIQLFIFATTPLITRIYTPDSFGQQATFLSILSIITIISSLGYSAAIIKEENAINALSIGMFSILISMCINLLLLASSVVLISILRTNAISNIVSPLLFSFVGAILATLTYILTQGLLRNNLAERIIWISAGATIMSQTLKIALGYYSGSSSGGGTFLIISNITGQLFGLFIAIKISLANISFRLMRENKIRSLLLRLPKLLRKHRSFPLYYAPQNLINAVGHQLPVLLIGALFGFQSAGIYSIAILALYTPARVFGEAISLNFQARTSELIRSSNSPTFFLKKSTIYLAVISFPAFAIIGVFGPQLFEEIFGESWRQAGNVAQLLSPLIYLQFIVQIYAGSGHILGLNREIFIYEIISTPLKSIGLIMGLYFYDSMLISLAIYSIAGCIGYVSLIWWISTKLETWSNANATGR